MKKILMFFIFAFVLAAPLSAQVNLGLNGYAGGGISFPLKDLEKNWKTGHHGAIGVGYRLTPGLEGVGRFAYHMFPVSLPGDTAGMVAPADITQDFDIHEYGIDLRANLAAPGLNFRPYGLIGAGMAKLPSEKKFFYCVGGGIKATLFPRINLFIEARYTRISVDDFDISYVPVSAGLNLSL